MKATYLRIIECFGAYLGEETIELEFDAEQAGDFVIVAFTEETLERLASLGLTTDELAGCEEAATEAFYEHEREACRALRVAQALGRVA